MEVGPHGMKLKKKGKTVLHGTEIVPIQHPAGMVRVALD